jgi:hypothetical protein
MGWSSFRRLWACRLAPEILTREAQAQLEPAQLEPAQLECVGSTPSSCASVYRAALKVLFDHMR